MCHWSRLVSPTLFSLSPHNFPDHNAPMYVALTQPCMVPSGFCTIFHSFLFLASGERRKRAFCWESYGDIPSAFTRTGEAKCKRARWQEEKLCRRCYYSQRGTFGFALVSSRERDAKRRNWINWKVFFWAALPRALSLLASNGSLPGTMSKLFSWLTAPAAGADIRLPIGINHEKMRRTVRSIWWEWEEKSAINVLRARENLNSLDIENKI